MWDASGLDIAAPGRAEVAIGAETQQEVAESLEVESAARRARVVPPVGLREEEPAGTRLVAAVDPGQVVGPGIVLVLRGKVVAQRAENAETAQRTQHRDLRRLIEEAVGRGHPESCSGRSAIPVSALNRARKAHAGFIYHSFAEGRDEVQAGHVVDRKSTRLNSSH